MTERTHSQRIYWIGGSKGGVGKSMTTMATIDCLLDHGEHPVLVETDTSNHDVWNAYHELVPSGLFDLDHADGWIDFLNTCDAHKDSAVIVNTAARNNVAVRQQGQTSTRASTSSRRTC